MRDLFYLCIGLYFQFAGSQSSGTDGGAAPPGGTGYTFYILGF